jgi:hypothetical protein
MYGPTLVCKGNFRGRHSGRYQFQHALYQQVLYKSLGTARRVPLHQRIGGRLEAGNVSPKISEPLLLPGKDGARLHKLQSPLPAGPETREPHPKQPITWAPAGARDCLLVHGDLMAQGDEFHLHGET